MIGSYLDSFNIQQLDGDGARRRAAAVDEDGDPGAAIMVVAAGLVRRAFSTRTSRTKPYRTRNTESTTTNPSTTLTMLMIGDYDGIWHVREG